MDGYPLCLLCYTQINLGCKFLNLKVEQFHFHCHPHVHSCMFANCYIYNVCAKDVSYIKEEATVKLVMLTSK